MYTQFCLHYREYAQQTKATMHLDHKPGEQMEVDWAGDTAKVTDPETGNQTPAYLLACGANRLPGLGIYFV